MREKKFEKNMGVGNDFFGGFVFLNIVGCFLLE
jgi:hypothetical protein